MNKDEYRCKKCEIVWGFCPEDYESELDYPTLCPLCNMPATQMIKDVYKEEGIVEVLKMLWIRLTK